MTHPHPRFPVTYWGQSGLFVALAALVLWLRDRLRYGWCPHHWASNHSFYAGAKSINFQGPNTQSFPVTCQHCGRPGTLRVTNIQAPLHCQITTDWNHRPIPPARTL